MGRSNATVTYAAAILAKSIGITQRKEARALRRLTRTSNSRSAAGRPSTAVLLASAAANASRASARSALPRLPSSAAIQASRASRVNSIARRFLRSAIHATVMTWMGCTAKSAAPTAAPRNVVPIAMSKATTSTELIPCSRTFVA